MSGIGIAKTLHLLGVIFWIGGMGARLLLLGFTTSGMNEAVRNQLYEAQRRIHLRMELPAFLLALLAGLFLVFAAGVTFHQTWFSVKMLLLLGVILLDPLVSRQFKAFRAIGKEGQAEGLLTVLVVSVLLMVLAALTKF